MRNKLISVLAVVLAATAACFAVIIYPIGTPSSADFPVIEHAPDFMLLNQEGENVSLGDLVGKIKVMTFIYVKCHMPKRCPLTAKNFRAMQELLAAEKDKVQFVSITFDPESDTPGALKEYGKLYGADFSNWVFLTGTIDQIEKVCDEYQIIHERMRPDDPSFRHSVITILVDEKNDVRKMYFANAWSPEYLAGDVRTLIEEI